MSTQGSKEIQIVALVIALSLGSVGCARVITPADLPGFRDDRVLGIWRSSPSPLSPGADQGTKEDRMVVRRSGSDDYFIGNEKNPKRFRLSRAGDNIVLMSPASGSDCTAFGSSSETCWAIEGRIEISQDKLTVYLIKEDVLVKDSFAGQLRIRHSIHRFAEPASNGYNSINRVYLDAPPARVLEFLGEYITSRPSAFVDAGYFYRAP